MGQVRSTFAKMEKVAEEGKTEDLSTIKRTRYSSN